MAAPVEGYVLTSYGSDDYLHHAVASAETLRRHDRRRPIALLCSADHRSLLRGHDLADRYDVIEVLPEEHQSIVGVKHHLDRFMPFDRNLYADTDIVWCRDPDTLWQELAAHPFTSTGDLRADVWFGAAKDIRIVRDIALNRRSRTLRRLGLTYLPRVLSAILFAQDREVTREVCATARHYLAHRHLTHFRSRLDEQGRSLESCEWSMALAMSELGLPVVPWHRGPRSPLLDYYPHTTRHDDEFQQVSYHLWTNRSVYDVQGLPSDPVRRAITTVLTQLPGRGEFAEVTPIALHFGQLPFKQPFYSFARRTWQTATARMEPDLL